MKQKLLGRNIMSTTQSTTPETILITKKNNDKNFNEFISSIACLN